MIRVSICLDEKKVILPKEDLQLETFSLQNKNIVMRENIKLKEIKALNEDFKHIWIESLYIDEETKAAESMSHFCDDYIIQNDDIIHFGN